VERPRDIIHLDMDAFYAAVEVLDDPSLSGKPVIVGGARERGVVSAASYEARRFGVHSAQPISRAMHLCPHGVYLPVRMARYKEISERTFEIFRRYTPLVEPLSIDEAFLDVSGSTRLFGSGPEIAKAIRREVREEIGLTVSAGVAPSKFLAKIASDLGKPDGLTVVPPDGVEAFLEYLPIEKLWGVGKVTLKSLSLLGLRTVGDLGRFPVGRLIKKFGKHGIKMHLLSRGIDPRDIQTERDVKSIGREETYMEDILDAETAQRALLDLCVRVARRIRRNRCKGRTITVKVKYADFVQITRSRTIPLSTDDAGEIFQICLGLLANTQVGRRPVRLLGVSMSQLIFSRGMDQRSLFEASDVRPSREKLNLALDTVYDKFGDRLLVPARLLKKSPPRGS
jgi:DNA polymerase-4